MSQGGQARLDDYLVLCDASGFKVWASETVMQWNGLRVHRRFADTRNPQDFVRAVRDDQSVSNPRSEPADTYIPGPGYWDISLWDEGGWQ